MRKTMTLLLLATVVIGGAGCHRRGQVAYAPTYYSGGYYASYQAQQPTVVVQQQPAVVYQQPTVVYQQPQTVYVQPAYQQPVVLQSPPPVYYYQPTGYYRRPAIWGGVRVYVGP